MSDNNYPPGNFCDQDGLMIDGLVLSPPDQGAGFDDIFKLSRVTGSKFYNVTVPRTAVTEPQTRAAVAEAEDGMLRS